jgi:hypothetical protein
MSRPDNYVVEGGDADNLSCLLQSFCDGDIGMVQGSSLDDYERI